MIIFTEKRFNLEVLFLKEIWMYKYFIRLELLKERETKSLDESGVITLKDIGDIYLF